MQYRLHIHDSYNLHMNDMFNYLLLFHVPSQIHRCVVAVLQQICINSHTHTHIQ